MFRNVLFFLCVTCLVTLTACSGVVAGSQVVQGSGNVISETRSVSAITRVEHGTIGDLTITLGDKESLAVEAEDNILPYIETSVANGTLTIRNKPEVSLRPSRPVRYRLTVKSLQSLANSSVGNITAPNLTGQTVNINLSSTGAITVDEVQADTLKVQSSSTGDITLKGGQAGRQEISLSSSGKYQASEVKSQSARVTISSSGDATIWVSDQLNANISSSGNVNCYGSPQITQQSSSSGKVVSRGSK